MKGYGQYCPISKAAEILSERWTLLVLRELLVGSRRYNDLRRGIPLISPTVLTERLKTLQKAGIVERKLGVEKKVSEYLVTPAGRELWPLIEQIGVWGQRWVKSKLGRDDLDASFLMWDIHRNLVLDQLPSRRVVIYVEFSDGKKGARNYWLVVNGMEVDLCIDDPGHEVDLQLFADVRTMTRIWMGDIALSSARAAGLIRMTGDGVLIRTMPKWLGKSHFADVSPVSNSVRWGLSSTTGSSVSRS
jgi:DNA-binding HxlR family transcriptional regulator